MSISRKPPRELLAELSDEDLYAEQQRRAEIEREAYHREQVLKNELEIARAWEKAKDHLRQCGIELTEAQVQEAADIFFQLQDELREIGL